MGAWSDDLLDNDGAQDVLAALHGASETDVATILEEAVSAFEDFLRRDGLGETFVPLSEEEVEWQSEVIQGLLSECPEQERRAERGDEANGLENDTGDHEAQGLVAAAVVMLAAAGDPKMLSATGLGHLGVGEDLGALMIRARSGITRLLDHVRIRRYLSPGWLANVAKLNLSLL